MIIEIIHHQMILSFLFIFIFIFILRFYFPSLNVILKLYVGILIIGLTLFSRFRERVDHALTFEFSYIYYFFSLFMLVLYIMSLLKLYEKNSLDKDSNKSKIKNFFKYILNEILEIYYNGLKIMANLFFRSSILQFFDSHVHYIYNYFLFPYSHYYQYIYFFIYIFPRILLSTAFFIDVIIFHYMCYLYKILWIVWIPLLFRIILYLLMHWGENFMNHYLEIFEILEKGCRNGKKYCNFNIKDESKQIYSFEMYQHLMIISDCLFDFQTLLSQAKTQKLIKYLLTFIFIIYITIWVYIFFQLSISLLIHYSFIII